MSITVGNTSSGNSKTVAHTNDRVVGENVVVASVGLVRRSGSDVTGVTYSGQAMTLAAEYDNGSGSFVNQVWYKIAGAASGNVVVSTSAGSNDDDCVIGVVTLNGVDEADVLGNTNTAKLTSGTDVTVDVTTTSSNNMVIDSATVRNTATVGTGQTQVANSIYESGGSSFSGCASYESATGSDVTMNWTASTSFSLGLIVGVEFKHLAKAPTVTTGTVVDLFETTGTIDTSNVTDEGTESVTERGVAVDTATAPEITDTKFTSGSGSGSYNTSMTSLMADTHYYCRAYATNIVGTSYGSEIEFTTDEDAAKPIIILDNPIIFS